MTYVSKIAKAAPEMMANRSDRRLPNLLVAQAHHEAAYVMRRRRADSIRTRTRLQGPSKVGYMRATDFSNCLQDKPSAEAGSIYALNHQAVSQIGQGRACGNFLRRHLAV
jgi:hypothetical protein